MKVRIRVKYLFIMYYLKVIFSIINYVSKGL